MAKAKYTGEGFPEGSPEALAVLGVDDRTVRCTCPPEWAGEGHAKDCAVTKAQPKPGKSVVGGAGDTVACTCPPEWKGEGHAKDCAKRAGGVACTCRTLKWTEEGHSPECVSQQPADAPKAKKGK